MAAVFVSYCRESHEKAKSLAQDLEALGHRAWFDQALTGGQSWWDHILDEIQKCDVFAFLLEQESLDSTACKREYSYAAKLRKSVLPVLIEENVDTSLLPEALAQIHFVDYRREDRDAFRALARALAALPPSPPLPDPLPDPPAAPVSYLSSLKEQLEASENLSFSEQTALVLRLKNGMRNAKDADQIRTMLKLFRSREDLYAKVADEIDGLLTNAPRPEATPASPPVPVLQSNPEPSRKPVPIAAPLATLDPPTSLDVSETKSSAAADVPATVFSIQKLVFALLAGLVLATASYTIAGERMLFGYGIRISSILNSVTGFTWALPAGVVLSVIIVWERLRNRAVLLQIPFLIVPVAFAFLINFSPSVYDDFTDLHDAMWRLMQCRFLVALVPLGLIAAVFSQSRLNSRVFSWLALIVGLLVAAILSYNSPELVRMASLAGVTAAIAFVVLLAVAIAKRFSAKPQR